MNQGQKQGWGNKAWNYITGYGTKSQYPPPSYNTTPFNPNVNQMPPSNWGMN